MRLWWRNASTWPATFICRMLFNVLNNRESALPPTIAVTTVTCQPATCKTGRAKWGQGGLWSATNWIQAGRAGKRQIKIRRLYRKSQARTWDRKRTRQPWCIRWKCFSNDRLEWLVSETQHFPIYVHLQSAAYRWVNYVFRIQIMSFTYKPRGFLSGTYSTSF